MLLLVLSAGVAAAQIVGTPNFGRIFSAKSLREMQFGLRFAF
jgi:hypothetical protein